MKFFYAFAEIAPPLPGMKKEGEQWIAHPPS